MIVPNCEYYCCVYDAQRLRSHIKERSKSGFVFIKGKPCPTCNLNFSAWLFLVPIIFLGIIGNNMYSTLPHK